MNVGVLIDSLNRIGNFLIAEIDPATQGAIFTGVALGIDLVGAAEGRGVGNGGMRPQQQGDLARGDIKPVAGQFKVAAAAAAPAEGAQGGDLFISLNIDGLKGGEELRVRRAGVDLLRKTHQIVRRRGHVEDCRLRVSISSKL